MKCAAGTQTAPPTPSKRCSYSSPEGDPGVFLATVLDAVCVDPKVDQRVVAIRPKAAFRAIFDCATLRSAA